MSNFHTPVLLDKVIEYLDIKTDHWYIDCNLGGGGHTKTMLDRGGKVLGIDVDPDAIAYVAQNILRDRLIIHQGNFANLQKIVSSHNLSSVSGILFDLGASSFQFDNPSKGFSFQAQSPLDMRMDPNLAVKAGDLLHGLNAGELEELFKKYGEEPQSKKIAQAIVAHRKVRLIKTAQELVDIILTVKPKSHKSIHPATLVFQALRIAVNDEINNLKAALPQALELLEPDGRLVVISFHSLEDRVVKEYIKAQVASNRLTSLTKKPVIATEAELVQNPRAKSAKLRAALRL